MLASRGGRSFLGLLRIVTHAQRAGGPIGQPGGKTVGFMLAPFHNAGMRWKRKAPQSSTRPLSFPLVKRDEP